MIVNMKIILAKDYFFHFIAKDCFSSFFGQQQVEIQPLNGSNEWSTVEKRLKSIETEPNEININVMELAS